ncbi:hypothetical protein [Streptomyces mirabilis]|uniref:hypothetical protein n=1 Tax=Streptomyces mirabilis TaxID=68239 RepID=UPI0036788788
MAVHLLAAALHGSQTVIVQRQVAAKSDEIPAFTLLLARFDLRGVVVTADAMHHTQRQTAKSTNAADGHYFPVVQGQPEEAVPIKRRRVNTKTGKVRTKTVYAITRRLDQHHPRSRPLPVDGVCLDAVVPVVRA